jgi:hypothetical protein
MLKATTSGFDKPLLEDVSQTIKLLPDVLVEEALDLAVQLEAELENIFSEAPPRGSEKFVWSLDPEKNKAAQGWWWHHIKKGDIPTDGKHYKRQGKPPRGGTVSIEATPDGVVITIANKWSKSGLLFGKLSKTDTDTRLPGHKRTGWQLAYPKYKRARAAFLQELDSRILARLRKR